MKALILLVLLAVCKICDSSTLKEDLKKIAELLDQRENELLDQQHNDNILVEASNNLKRNMAHGKVVRGGEMAAPIALRGDDNETDIEIIQDNDENNDPNGDNRRNTRRKLKHLITNDLRQNEGEMAAPIALRGDDNETAIEIIEDDGENNDPNGDARRNTRRKLKHLVLRDEGETRPINEYKCVKDDAEYTRSVKESFLYAHNNLRTRHGAPALTWDVTLAASCQVHSDWMAANLNMSHTPAIEYGENIGFKAISKKNVIFGPPGVVMDMYNEIVKYDFQKHSGPGTGHFTQLVWQSTRRVGCSVTSTLVNKWEWTYMCCQYKPPGNVPTLFDENVKEPASGKQRARVDDVDIDHGCDYFSKCHRYPCSIVSQACGYSCHD